MKAAYFSATAMRRDGHVARYATPAGGEVECTEVCDPRRKPICDVADTEYVGLVTRFLGRRVVDAAAYEAWRDEWQDDRYDYAYDYEPAPPHHREDE